MHTRSNHSSPSGFGRLLILLFLLTLPLVNPWVRGDGVGYYAYARALLLQQDLHFEKDWLAANPTFRMGRVNAAGHINPSQYTPTGHLENHFSIGPAFLWIPFLAVTHVAVLAADALGAHVAADGFSRPYIITMALSTACYAFWGLWLTFRVAGNYFQERWAFLSTVGIWLASSLPVYMYFNPSWSHAHSVFTVGLFLWYWERTRGHRTTVQWMLLGLLSGLMMNVYYPNGILMLIPAVEALSDYYRACKDTNRRTQMVLSLLVRHVLFVAVALISVLPTLIAKWVIFGDPLDLGYRVQWYWTSPVLLQVLFSSNHGLLSWTPILLLAVLGLFLLWGYDRQLCASLLAAFFGFFYFISSYSSWNGLSSYGNRFFVSLTPLFVLGLAATLETCGHWLADTRRAFASASAVVALFILWNVGLLFQWGTHMIPVRGPIVWREMVYNQVRVVPVHITRSVAGYLTGRRAMMEEIEQRDKRGLESQEPPR